ncbi:putative transaldolase [Holospora obtusa F1]|uniref:Transaldolase n=2 Tax=Holospora obtusa TaxID=49893 RepID=W6TI02_HOLOB|nr:putative transaldolase [Holospora obtusa F1]
MGIIKGVTTNPSLVAKKIKKLSQHSDNFFEDLVKRICEVVPGFPVSVEVTAESSDEMVRQGICFAEWSSQVVVKIPLTSQGLEACFRLTQQGIPVNITLCFSLNQAFLASQAGATYISVFLGRLEDDGKDAFQVIQETYQMLQHTQSSSKLLAASVRTASQVHKSIVSGVHIATVPFSVLEEMIFHHLTEKGVNQFKEDSQIFVCPISALEASIL